MMKLARHWRTVGGAVLALCAVSLPSVALAWEPTDEVEFVSHAETNSSTWAFMNAVISGIKEKNLLPEGIRISVVTGSSGGKARSYLAVQHAGNPYVIGILSPSQVNGMILANSSITIDGFRGIAIMQVSPKVLVVNVNSKYRSMKDLIDDAKARPGAVVQGGGFVGTTTSLLNKTLEDKFGIRLSYVPFDDQGIVQIVGGHIDFAIEAPEQVLKFVKAGKLRILATSNKLDEYPDVPTFKEAGYDFPVLDSYRGFWASKGMPDDVVKFYADVFSKARDTEAYTKFTKANGAVDMWMSGSELDAYLKNDSANYRHLDEEMNLIGSN
jgi:putative tricarboxylic transport membrane protein